MVFAYRLLAGGALWPPSAWRVFAWFNASSFFNNFKNFQNVWWHAVTVAWKLLCHPTMQLVVLGSLSNLLWNISQSLIEKSGALRRAFLVKRLRRLRRLLQASLKVFLRWSESSSKYATTLSDGTNTSAGITRKVLAKSSSFVYLPCYPACWILFQKFAERW